MKTYFLSFEFESTYSKKQKRQPRPKISVKYGKLYTKKFKLSSSISRTAKENILQKLH